MRALSERVIFMLVGVAGAHAEALSAQGSCGAAQGHFLVLTSPSCAHRETGVPLHATENERVSLESSLGSQQRSC